MVIVCVADFEEDCGSRHSNIERLTRRRGYAAALLEYGRFFLHLAVTAAPNP